MRVWSASVKPFGGSVAGGSVGCGSVGFVGGSVGLVSGGSADLRRLRSAAARLLPAVRSALVLASAVQFPPCQHFPQAFGFRCGAAFGRGRTFRFFFLPLLRFCFRCRQGERYQRWFQVKVRHRFGYTAVRCRAAVGRCFVCITSRKGEYHQPCKKDCGHFPFRHHDHLYLHNTEKLAKVQRNRKVSRKKLHTLCRAFVLIG